MKNLILTVVMVVSAMFATVGTAEAASKSCCPVIKKCCCKPTTVEICRRHFCKTKCVFGCVKTIRYVEVTYKKTDRCGRCKTFKKVYRCK